MLLSRMGEYPIDFLASFSLFELFLFAGWKAMRFQH
jgi:hypothetical protein